MSSISQKLDDGISIVSGALEQIRHDLSRIPSTVPSQREASELEIEKKLNEVDQRLNKMNADLRSVPANSREFFENEIFTRRNDYNQCATELQRYRLIAKGDPEAIAALQAERNKQLAANITSNLDDALNVGQDTINTQNNTMNTLVDDRGHIVNINNNLDRINEEALTGTARAKRMVRRFIMNGIVAWVMVVILLAFLAFSLWFKLR